MIIKMKRVDIQKGEKGQPSSCPIARAIRRETGLFVRVGVGSVRLPQVGFLKDKYAPLSRVAKAFIDKFDSGQKVQPISFRLNLK